MLLRHGWLQLSYIVNTILGTSDFYSANHYSTSLIRPARPGEDAGVWVVTGSPELNAVLMAPKDSEGYGPFPLLVVSSYFDIVYLSIPFY